MIKEQLEKNIKIILNSAELVYNSKDYTSSTILYFKTIFSVLDLILLKSEGKTPKDHKERFRMLELSHKNLYEFMDKYFKIYRDTYSISIDKETCKDIRKNVKRIIKEHKIPI
jgi:uncharacterized protein (UPF0332 family)